VHSYIFPDWHQKLVTDLADREAAISKKCGIKDFVERTAQKATLEVLGGKSVHGWTIEVLGGKSVHGWTIEVLGGKSVHGWTIEVLGGKSVHGWTLEVLGGKSVHGWTLEVLGGKSVHGWTLAICLVSCNNRGVRRYTSLYSDRTTRICRSRTYRRV
jgi:hypothetical protein